MAKPNTGHQSWWSGQSRRKKVLLLLTILIIILGLALGLGLGLTIGREGGEEEEEQPPTTIPPGTNGTTWQPAVNSTWQIALLHPLDLSDGVESLRPDVGIYDIDLFTNPPSTIQALHRAGKRVICYFSAGSYEDFRPDSSQFKKDDLGKELDGWPGERWLNLRSETVWKIIEARMRMAREKGCDAVDPDNVDGYQNDNGVSLTQADSERFMLRLSSLASNLSMSIGLKNAADLIPSLISRTQFSVNEQCVQFSECSSFSPYISAGKPVFHIEYPHNAPQIASNDTFCRDSGQGEGSELFSTVLKDMDLDGYVQFCNGQTANTTLSL
ncbi:hypothetical protein P152DRAFT_397604 [Eremomyces bilateralis CBS 781.70]|uniref:alpha-galactosidase n=1 Tax=Eremomyces bilateralis CBS 781.70 TaxID=1392243 RepID=A0A6G1G2B4_9PEZI|nr:uncharacterized protein P152DRAFT_397604 [Eremomyces bilateralis CBS 781.70]KAF1812158.1 hypothetical protein P152DRAFT_397604 [Eremomyces bilateralis CBS 781.70]